VEEVILKEHQNTLATQKIFEDIHQRKPEALLILGDVVSIGSKASKWKNIDRYLAELRREKTIVSALLGNHDLMFTSKKGEKEFLKRFPDEINTGSYKVCDSIALILLNSNFKTLSSDQLKKQQEFYQTAMLQLNADNAVKFIVVTCHHPPYSNSKIVGSNKQVQENFVPLFLQSAKAKLFVTGHAHVFEHFKREGKDFLTLGGGGGLHQPLNNGVDRIPSENSGYDPEFHYEILKRDQNRLNIISRFLKTDFSGFSNGYQFYIE
jgi:Icc-related predicted phosphoesterase